MEAILKWFESNWGWAIAIISAFIEITPIKVKPLSALLRWLGKKLTLDIRNDVKEINERLDKQEEKIDTNRAEEIKGEILDFANSCRNGRKHSIDEYAHIFEINDTYEEIVEKYKIKNGKYHESFEYIKRCYHNCLDENSFLA